jgi:hypothetical protein
MLSLPVSVSRWQSLSFVLSALSGFAPTLSAVVRSEQECLEWAWAIERSIGILRDQVGQKLGRDLRDWGRDLRDWGWTDRD